MYRIKQNGKTRIEYFEKAVNNFVFLLHHKSKYFSFTPSGVMISIDYSKNIQTQNQMSVSKL